MDPAPSIRSALLALPERRSRRRQFCRLPAVIHAGPAGIGLEAMVEDLDASGARLRLSRRALITADFRIVLPTVSVAYDGRLLWRRNLDLGVEFLRRHDLLETPVS